MSPLSPRSTPLFHRSPRPLKVCLVRPPVLTNVSAVLQDAVLPLGLAYLAGALGAAGHQVSAVDAVGEAVDQYSHVPGNRYAVIHGLRSSEVLERIRPDADVIGVSCMFSSDWLSTRPLIQEIRRAFPRVFVVLGGEHVTALPAYALASAAGADALVLGEGEETFLDLLEARANGNDPASVRGIAFRNGDSIARPPARPRISAIDEIPEPDWTVFPVNHYLDNALAPGVNLGRSMPILGSRGCPYQCTFCSSHQMWTSLWKARAPERVIAEMKKYIEAYRARNFTFYDSTAIVRRDWILGFCRLLIGENLGITWQLPFGTRSEVIDEEVARLLYASGCRLLDFAPESGSPAELKRMKKKVSLERMLVSMADAHRAGMQIKVNFIFGLPESTWADVARTWRFIFRLAVMGVSDMSAFAFSPYPGSELFERLVAAGRLRLDDEYLKSLLAYADAVRCTSYSDRISSRVLPILNLFTMAYFYSLSFLFRPARFVRLLKLFLARDGSARLTMVLINRRRKREAIRLLKKLGKETVTVSLRTQPRECA